MSMKKLILDRLIEVAKLPAEARAVEAEDRASQAGAANAALRLEFARANERLTKATNDMELLRSKTSGANVLLTELYRAAENMAQAKTIGQLNAARPRLTRALAASEKYIDLIPF